MLAGQQRLQRPCSARRAAVVRPCSVKRSKLACRASSERFPAQVCIVLGTQWGDEGKGKLVDILAQQYDVIARAQVSSVCCSAVAAQQRDVSGTLTAGHPKLYCCCLNAPYSGAFASLVDLAV
jgi:hypothetical protein